MGRERRTCVEKSTEMLGRSMRAQNHAAIRSIDRRPAHPSRQPGHLTESASPTTPPSDDVDDKQDAARFDRSTSSPSRTGTSTRSVKRHKSGMGSPSRTRMAADRGKFRHCSCSTDPPGPCPVQRDSKPGQQRPASKSGWRCVSGRAVLWGHHSRVDPDHLARPTLTPRAPRDPTLMSDESSASRRRCLQVLAAKRGAREPVASRPQRERDAFRSPSDPLFGAPTSEHPEPAPQPTGALAPIRRIALLVVGKEELLPRRQDSGVCRPLAEWSSRRAPGVGDRANPSPSQGPSLRDWPGPARPGDLVTMPPRVRLLEVPVNPPWVMPPKEMRGLLAG